MRIDVRFELELHLRRNFGVLRAILKHYDPTTCDKEDKLGTACASYTMINQHGRRSNERKHGTVGHNIRMSNSQ